MATGAALSNYAENVAINYLLNASAVTRPTAWYVGLFSDTTGMTTDQPGSELTSGTAAGYARQSVTFNTATTGTCQNTNTPTFTASGAWPTANYVGVFDALTTGNLLFWGALTVSKTLANTDQMIFAANSISISLD